MKTQNKQNGSALILVVVVTVLLAVIGVMFLMVSRASEMETAAVIQNKDLTSAVDTVVAKINEVLVEDLFGQNANIVDADSADEPWDYPFHRLDPGPDGIYDTGDETPFAPGPDGSYGTLDDIWLLGLNDDTWLASLEPTVDVDGFGNPVYYWGHITDLFNNNFGVPYAPVYYDPQNELNDPEHWDGTAPEFIVDAQGTLVKIISPKERTYVIQESAADWSYDLAGARADADGDGVADSRWVQVPGLTTSRGEPVFAAIRIIDNCAMLNLNAAHCFYQDDLTISPFLQPWFENDTTVNEYHNNESGTGRYLTEINYRPFLRGSDLSDVNNWYRIQSAKGFGDISNPAIPQFAHGIFMNIENPAVGFHFFDISDELELRNRYIITSKVEARFENPNVANFTLDAGGANYAILETPVDDNTAFNAWKIKVDSFNFDDWDEYGSVPATPMPDPYEYDRRRVCTFYSYDRNIRTGQYSLLKSYFDSALTGGLLTEDEIKQIRQVFMPSKYMPVDLRAVDISQNTPEARKQILHLLYAFRAFYLSEGLSQNDAAIKSAQIVANMIDYLDNNLTGDQGPFYGTQYDPINGTGQRNPNRIYINHAIVRELVYEVSQTIFGIGSEIDTNTEIQYAFFDMGFSGVIYGHESQPFISEIYCERDTGGNVQAFGLELVNPYIAPLSLDGWRISIGVQNYDLNDPNFSVPMGNPDGTLGRFTIWGSNAGFTVPENGADKEVAGIGLGGQLNANVIKLYRPDHINAGQYVLVDQTDLQQTTDIFSVDGVRVSKRDDTNWKYANNSAYAPVDAVGTLGQVNNVTVSGKRGYSLSVRDSYEPFYRLGDFEKVLLSGYDPNGITEAIALATDESDIHYDIETHPELMDYVCFLNRPDLGSLPGRININTAPVHVIAAAIPPVLADPNAADPLKTVTFSALQLAQAIIDYRESPSGPFEKISDLLNITEFKQYDTGGAWESKNVGMQSIEDDIEEKHWVLSNLANKLTVRSDVFTAYILVRLGTDGPQRRMIGIFDRSQVWDKNDRPKLVALHPVPDPR